MAPPDSELLLPLSSVGLVSLVPRGSGGGDGGGGGDDRYEHVTPLPQLPLRVGIGQS